MDEILLLAFFEVAIHPSSLISIPHSSGSYLWLNNSIKKKKISWLLNLGMTQTYICWNQKQCTPNSYYFVRDPELYQSIIGASTFESLPS